MKTVFLLPCMLLMVTGSIVAYAANPFCQNTDDPATVTWSNKLLDALSQEQSCSTANSDDAFQSTDACNIFVGRVLKTVYGVNDFVVDPPVSGKVYYTANEISTFLTAGIWSGWSQLGSGDDQGALQEAANQAVSGKIVIAVWANPSGSGHVALIGPGPLKHSDSWGVDVPVAASFTINSRTRAFIGQPLSCAFSSDKQDDVTIWVKSA